jgi:hypothetical protein
MLVLSLLGVLCGPGAPMGPTNLGVSKVADSQKTIKITGFAICPAQYTPGTACGSVTLIGSRYDGPPVSPNAFVGFDYGRFTFENVTVPNDFSDSSFTVKANTSTASAGISKAADCQRDFTIKGSLVVGDTYAIDFGTGPWGWNNLCK